MSDTTTERRFVCDTYYHGNSHSYITYMKDTWMDTTDLSETAVCLSCTLVHELGIYKVT